jgi:hypothetical protein
MPTNDNIMENGHKHLFFFISFLSFCQKYFISNWKYKHTHTHKYRTFEKFILCEKFGINIHPLSFSPLFLRESKEEN